jgi:hypothetical protein
LIRRSNQIIREIQRLISLPPALLRSLTNYCG